MKPLLTAYWNNLVMLNYEIDPVVLQPYLPAGTELDSWNNRHYISLVAFRFCNPKIKSLHIPFYTNFVQINLRFYVRQCSNDDCKRGVVFIKEIAQGRLLKTGASLLYNERYTNLKTRHFIQQKDDAPDVEYKWLPGKEWDCIHAIAYPHKIIPAEGSAEAFILNRFWGYTQVTSSKTAAFRIDHEPWHIHALESLHINCSSKALYGEDLHAFLSKKPAFAFMADGSYVKVYNKKLCSN
jgi:uncharacterized protein